MTSREYREWAARMGVRHGSSGIDCVDVADAERYVADYPVDAHDLAVCGTVEVEYSATDAETVARLRAILTAAGYRRGDEGWWVRDGYMATATYHSGHRKARINVYPADGHVAWAAGAGGYLPSGSRP